MVKPEIETAGTKVVYKNRWMTVREDTIVRADGSSGLYGVVEKPDFSVIAAVSDGSIVLVEQYRYPVQERFWELPQGSWEDPATQGPVMRLSFASRDSRQVVYSNRETRIGELSKGIIAPQILRERKNERRDHL